MEVTTNASLSADDYASLTKGLSVEERIRGYLLSAESDHTLRSGIDMTDAERKMLTEGAAWERAMHRTFKGICTRRDRRLALRRAAERLGIRV